MSSRVNGGPSVHRSDAGRPPSSSYGGGGGAPMQEDLTAKDYYFNSYSHFSIHEQMIKDKVRTDAYMHSIMDNKHLFKGKVVLDVGCGTGILSMFAAKAGARRVIGLECAAIAHQAQQIVADNGLAEVVTIVHGKAEEVELPAGVEQVDIIISEWMGYCLLYESMLDTVLYARDKWLAPGGLLFPDKATLFVCGIEDREYMAEKMHWWDNVYGFDMSCIKKIAMREPLVDNVDAAQVCTDVCTLLNLDLRSCTAADLAFSAPFSITLQRDDFVHALVLFFDTSFSACHKPVGISTSPANPPTHWKQTVLYLEDELVSGVDETISGRLRMGANPENHRDMDIALSYEFRGEHSDVVAEHQYRLR